MRVDIPRLMLLWAEDVAARMQFTLDPEKFGGPRTSADFAEALPGTLMLYDYLSFFRGLSPSLGSTYSLRRRIT
ncbi:hypothetical protein P3T36_003863 [Kitasatospora sp. MAP12-15]|uniref:hypothetical protein n=1 Tax=unclassified Kitasatospora TaxID=2633591 RepID=UPI0024758DC9|nr:hypothetical protein [Kitasatospora sp. MAP12-44]MDH6108493.1 hypothetical protein [Kitasatospora sp. MAP12-44]